MKKFLGFFLAFLLSTIGYSANVVSGASMFKEVQSTRLQLESEVFSHVVDLAHLPDGYLLLVSESPNGNRLYIIKVDGNGNVTRKYKEQGFGPGQLSCPGNLLVTPDLVLVSELTTPYIHQFDHQLNFQKDYRVKKQGRIRDLGKYFGIWSISDVMVHGKHKKYILALYQKETFKFVKYAFEIKEEPANVFTWGGLCRVDDNALAGVYSNEYRIRFFDSELSEGKSIVYTVPDHIVKYQPFKGPSNVVNTASLNWWKTWSVMHSLYYCRDKFILNYRYGESMYMDIYNRDGSPFRLNLKMDEGPRHFFHDGQYFYHLKEKNTDTDRVEYLIIKEKFVAQQ